MRLLFISGLFSEEMETKILANTISGSVQYAANKFQKNIIMGLSNNKSLNISVLSAAFVGTFPREYKKMYFYGKEEKIVSNVHYKSVSFLNVWGLRNIYRKNRIIKELKEFIDLKDDQKVIMVYSTHTPFLEAAVHAKKKDPTIHICLVVPDLPHFMNLSANRTNIYDKLKKIDIKIFDKNLQYVDSFVLLTEEMKQVLKVENRPYTIVEGIADASQVSMGKIHDSNINTIVYTGTLNEKFGVLTLVQSFHYLNREDVTLKICGRGDAEEQIREYANKDSRIKFLGQLSNKDAMLLQQEATVLINPRQNNEEFTKYSFPSKNMEYLLTGKPVIAYKLDGIPSEYDKYFYYIKDDSPEEMSKTIDYVLSLSRNERKEFGKKAQEFVLKEKNQYRAGEKILSMIKENRGI